MKFHQSWGLPSGTTLPPSTFLTSSFERLVDALVDFPIPVHNRCVLCDLYKSIVHSVFWLLRYASNTLCVSVEKWLYCHRLTAFQHTLGIHAFQLYVFNNNAAFSLPWKFELMNTSFLDLHAFKVRIGRKTWKPLCLPFGSCNLAS